MVPWLMTIRVESVTGNRKNNQANVDTAMVGMLCMGSVKRVVEMGYCTDEHDDKTAIRTMICLPPPLVNV
jgi:hypothetical protein